MTDTPTHKQRLRQEIRQRRVDLPDRRLRSEKIQKSTWNLARIQAAQVVMVYVGHRSEVQTELLISHLFGAGKTVFVPWCDGDELQLFRLESCSELQPGAFGIPEPSAELRRFPERTGLPGDLEVVLIPGIAFDRDGQRLGQGKGYYDRLLDNVSDRCLLIGLAYDIQLVERVPVEIHDISLDLIVTESEVIHVTP